MIVALNGYRSPVDDDFREVAPRLIESGQVACPYVPNWTGSNRDIETVTDAAKGDYILAGFSDGCWPLIESLALILACELS